MKLFLLLIKFAAIGFTTATVAQSLLQCPDKTVYWIIPSKGINYTVMLKGDVSLSSQHDILNVNENALQYSIADKSSYIDNNENNDAHALLKRYTDQEKEYLKNSLEVSFGTNEIIELNNGTIVFFWYFKYPKGKNKKVTAQLFVNITTDNHIFGLGAPLFTGEDFNVLYAFLCNTIATVSTTQKPEALCRR